MKYTQMNTHKNIQNSNKIHLNLIIKNAKLWKALSNDYQFITPISLSSKSGIVKKEECSVYTY